ncbi:MAG: TetR/AcrR family transcriptional regulator [Oceanicoccus sp.]
MSIATRKKVASRKKPSQKRSQATVKSILTATRGLLVKQGLNTLTTNHIANGADISVGSLYQYFPNKQAIISELYTAWLSEVRNEMESFIGHAVSGDTSNEDLMFTFFQLIYDGWKDGSDDLKFVREMHAATRLFPDLIGLDQAHGLLMADILAKIMKVMGSEKDDEELKKIGLYLYGIHNAFENIIVSHQGDMEAMLILHEQSLQLFINNMLENP